MSKSELTIQLEHQIWESTVSQGTFGCLEVTIGWFGKERVDYLTYNTKGDFRCYEIKISKSDFHSNNANTFVGNLNYYVMPFELYKVVKDEIPKEIGVFTSDGYHTSCRKKAKRQHLLVDKQVLTDSLIRSLFRDVDKIRKSNEPILMDRLRRELSSSERRCKRETESYWELLRKVQGLYGDHWEHPNAKLA